MLKSLNVRLGFINKEEEMELCEEIVFEWAEAVDVDETRVGAMYCFKSCTANQN